MDFRRASRSTCIALAALCVHCRAAPPTPHAGDDAAAGDSGAGADGGLDGGESAGSGDQLGAGDRGPGDRAGGDRMGGDSPGDGSSGDRASGDAEPRRLFYAAPGASGSECTRASPCSLVGARDRIRPLLSSMTADVSVRLRGGTYALASTFVLDGSDSGRNGFSVIWEAEPGETPVISGGTILSGWTLFDAGRGIYAAPAPPGLATRQLYVDGVRAQRARSAANPSGFTVESFGYTTTDATLQSWGNPDQLEVVAFADWKAYRCSVATIVGLDITMDTPCWDDAQYPPLWAIGQPAWLENAYELLDAPGEWYHDVSANVVYYAPRPQENLATATVVAPELQTLVHIEGTAVDPASALVVRGLHFAYATWMQPSTPQGYPVLQGGVLGNATFPGGYDAIPAHVELRLSSGVTFEGNTFEHLGATALSCAYGCQDTTVAGNRFVDISGGAIRLSEFFMAYPTPAETVRDNAVTDNYIADVAVEYYDVPAVMGFYPESTTVAHNEIRRTGGAGIAMGWGWGGVDPTVAQSNVVERNVIQHTMRRIRDAGSIYTLGAQPSSRITANVISGQIGDYGAVYLDNGTQGYTVEDNVVASAPFWSNLQIVLMPYASNNIVRNNLSDGSPFLCCWNMTCCDSFNTIGAHSTFSPGGWPAGALSTLAAAGIRSSHTAARPTRERLEAEDYDHGGPGVGFADLSMGNQGGAYRGDDADIVACEGCSNHHALGQTETGEWVRYTPLLPAGGTFDFEISAATVDPGAGISILIDGVTAANVGLPDTGDLSTFSLTAAPGITMTAGARELTLFVYGAIRLDFVDYQRR